MKKLLFTFVAACAAFISCAQGPTVSAVTPIYRGDDTLSFNVSGETFTTKASYLNVHLIALTTPNKTMFSQTGIYIGSSPGYWALNFQADSLQPGTVHRVQVMAYDDSTQYQYFDFISTTGTAPVTSIIELQKELPNEMVCVYETGSGRLIAECELQMVLLYLRQRGFVGNYTISSKTIGTKTFGLL